MYVLKNFLISEFLFLYDFDSNFKFYNNISRHRAWLE